MYRYFVSYVFVSSINNVGFGRRIVNVNKKISEHKHIEAIEENIRKEHEFESVGLQNFILLAD